MKVLGVALLVAVLGLGAAGCGSADPSGDSESSITKEEFVAQANAICAKANKKLQAAGGKVPDNPTKADGVAFWNDILIPSFRSQTEQIRALGAPSGDEDQVESLLTELDSANLKAQQIVDAGNLNADDPYSHASQLASDYGLDECDT